MACLSAVTADVVVLTGSQLVLTVSLEVEAVAGILRNGASRGPLKGLFVVLTPVAVAAVVAGLVVGGACLMAARASHGQ